ncbi:MAG: flagellar motor switch protein FliM [Betaproteobacteria bacterium]
MAQEFLSPDEVDTLLRGADAQAAPAAAPGSAAHAYDAAREERIVHGRMPVLEAINGQLVRLLRVAIFDFVRRKPDLSSSQLRLTRYHEFEGELASPANLNIVQLKPLRGSALLVLDRDLVYAVIDSLFGGNGRALAAGEEKEFTPTEQRISRRLVELVVDAIQGAWRPVYPLGMDYLRSETRVQSVSIAEPHEIVAVTTFAVSFGTTGGKLHVCIPYAALEPIRDRLAAPARSDRAPPDKRWMHRLSAQVQFAEVELTADLARIPLRVSQLLGMKVGDVIGFDPPEAVTAQVDGIPIFECRYGVLNRQYAIKVERVLTGDFRNAQGEDLAA